MGEQDLIEVREGFTRARTVNRGSSISQGWDRQKGADQVNPKTPSVEGTHVLFAESIDWSHKGPIGGHFGIFADQWEKTTTDAWVKETITSGLALKFLTVPRVFVCCPKSRDTTKRRFMETAIQHLIDIAAVEPVPVSEQGTGYYSMPFVVQKTSEGLQPILNLKCLNRFLRYRRFRGDLLTSIDLTKSYLHILIHQDQRWYLRFYYDSRHLQYQALPFGLASTPRIFTKILAALGEVLRSKPICI